MPHNTERRFTPVAAAPIGVQTRADGAKQITGYGAVFHVAGDERTEFLLWDYGGQRVVERIMPGAFDRAIREAHDARGLFNHDPSNLLGRVSSGTMRLSVDAVGLRYEIDPPDAEIGRQVLTSIERRDLTGSSFSFRPTRVVWVEEEEQDIRQVEDLELYDAGPVTYPAYAGSTSDVRSAIGDESLSALRDEHQRFKAGGELARRCTGDAVGVRAALVRIEEDSYTRITR